MNVLLFMRGIHDFHENVIKDLYKLYYVLWFYFLSVTLQKAGLITFLDLRALFVEWISLKYINFIEISSLIIRGE